MVDNSNINPISPIPDFGENLPSSSDQTLNSLGNQLWLATYFLFNQSGVRQADQTTFGMAMEAINAFMTYCKDNPSVLNTDSYLHNLWDVLQGTDGDHPQSLAALASNYAQSGFSQDGLNAFNNFLSNPGEFDFYNAFAGLIEQWGSKEGGYQPFTNPNLDPGNFSNLIYYFSKGNYSAFFNAINIFIFELSSAPQPFDGVSQSFLNLLKMPLDSGGDTLESLAQLAKTDPTTAIQKLQSILSANPSLSQELTDLFAQYKTMEFPQ